MVYQREPLAASLQGITGASIFLIHVEGAENYLFHEICISFVSTMNILYPNNHTGASDTENFNGLSKIVTENFSFF